MTEFVIRIAGVSARVSAQFPSTREFCRDYLYDGGPELSVTVTQEDLALEQRKADREAEREGRKPCVWPEAALECTAVQRKLAEELFQRNVLVFHGSVVAVDGYGYLFTAKSGTGKSTHTRLWRACFGERALMVNDDKPFLRVTPQGVMVCGSPWSGKHGIHTNVAVPLRAICVLERGKENGIQKILPADALPMLMQQSNRPTNTQNAGKYLDLIDMLTTSVAFYRMQCTISHEAAQLAYETMSGNQ